MNENLFEKKLYIDIIDTQISNLDASNEYTNLKINKNNIQIFGIKGIFSFCYICNTIFNSQSNFNKSAFKGVAKFNNCTFGSSIDATKTIDLSEIVFEDNAYFDECEFNHFVAFYSSSFKKTASFYKAKFNVMPNFSPGAFQGILNLNNTEWFDGKKAQEFNFDIIKNNLEKAYSNHDFAENIINFRSSFCGIKKTLLANQNLLDAKNFHKAELYCKEMELDCEIQNDEKKRREYNKK